MKFLSLQPYPQTQDTPQPALGTESLFFIKIPHKKSPRVTSTGAILPQIQIFYLYFHFSIAIIQQIVYNCYTFLERGYVSLARSVQRSERHRLSPPPLLAKPPISVKVLSHPLTWEPIETG